MLSHFYLDALSPHLYFWFCIFISLEFLYSSDMKCNLFLKTYFSKSGSFFSQFPIKPINSHSHFLFFVSKKVEVASISTKNKSYYCHIFKEGIPLKSTLLTYKYSVSLIITCKFVQAIFKYRILSYPLINI